MAASCLHYISNIQKQQELRTDLPHRLRLPAPRGSWLQPPTACVALPPTCAAPKTIVQCHVETVMTVLIDTPNPEVAACAAG